MMDSKEAMDKSVSQESYLVTENNQVVQKAKMEEQHARDVMLESRRLRELAAEEVNAERQRYAQLEAHQRPVLPSLHEEIMYLRTELNVQNNELRTARSELHVASARSSEWEHAGNSVGFPSTHVSHTPVTIISPAGSNSKNESQAGTPERGDDNGFPPMTFGPKTTVTYGPGSDELSFPMPMGPPITFGPKTTVTYGPGSDDLGPLQIAIQRVCQRVIRRKVEGGHQLGSTRLHVGAKQSYDVCGQP